MNMDWSHLLKLITVFQIFDLSQNSYVQDAKHRIRAEVRDAIGHPPYHQRHHRHGWQEQQQTSFPFATQHYEHYHEGSRRVHRLHSHHRNRWSSGHRKSMEHHHFTGWSAWSHCNSECVKRRERYCKVKRKCGFTKHVEERKCWHCLPTIGGHQHTIQPSSYVHQQQQQQQQQQTINQGSSPPQSIIINAAAAASGPPLQQFVLPTQPPTPMPPHETIVHHHISIPVLQEIVDHQQFHPSYEKDETVEQDYLHPPHYSQAGSQEQEETLEDIDAAEVSPTTLSPLLTMTTTLSPLSLEEHSAADVDDFYVLNTRPKYRKQRQSKPIYIDEAEYADLEDEELDSIDDEGTADTDVSESSEENVKNYKQFGPVHSIRSHHQRRKNLRKGRARSLRFSPRSLEQTQHRSLLPMTDEIGEGIEGDTSQYEDFDFDRNTVAGPDLDGENQYSDSYEDSDYTDSATFHRNSTFLLQSKEKATPDALIPRRRRIYSKWSNWTKCSPKCTTRRYRKCRVREQCGREVLREIAYCYTEGSFCQQWLQAQVQKSPPYEMRPMAAARRRDTSVDGGGTQSNAIVSDFIMNSKGYRGPEYTPQKLKCGIAPIRNNKRNLYNMLKIIGGKASRKGEWPWQVAIFNRFKEAFCGGTLIAPQWVLTAAHCVRKVLYVRIGEHNLDYGEGTELQLRVLKSFKHPNFDKKTVDSDVALLRLPKPINTTTWIGFSCLPRPYQPLPKNVDCTVIGWGKRRNRDAAGTSVLHQAEVPIISMDNCRSVYQDYTITKNMFCAGHKRGRIDTCAGDSGGPLLCRDTTKPNHPWTIFGITSFGDGCAKRNKFGIYAKVPNYVDWVWSVINCNGNCKLHQRNYG